MAAKVEKVKRQSIAATRGVLERWSDNPTPKGHKPNHVGKFIAIARAERKAAKRAARVGLVRG
jgi:hypothetical protein